MKMIWLLIKIYLGLFAACILMGIAGTPPFYGTICALVVVYIITPAILGIFLIEKLRPGGTFWIWLRKFWNKAREEIQQEEYDKDQV